MWCIQPGFCRHSHTVRTRTRGTCVGAKSCWRFRLSKIQQLPGEINVPGSGTSRFGIRGLRRGCNHSRRWLHCRGLCSHRRGTCSRIDSCRGAEATTKIIPCHVTIESNGFKGILFAVTRVRKFLALVHYLGITWFSNAITGSSSVSFRHLVPGNVGAGWNVSWRTTTRIGGDGKRGWLGDGRRGGYGNRRTARTFVSFAFGRRHLREGCVPNSCAASSISHQLEESRRMDVEVHPSCGTRSAQVNGGNV